MHKRNLPTSLTKFLRRSTNFGLCLLIAVALFAPERTFAQDAGTYTVASGDTLGAIANRFGVTVEDLAAVNGIADPNLLAVGQVLSIPTGTGVAVAAAGTGAGYRRTARRVRAWTVTASSGWTSR